MIPLYEKKHRDDLIQEIELVKAAIQRIESVIIDGDSFKKITIENQQFFVEYDASKAKLEDLYKMLKKSK